jgi:ATP-dependent protease HslVU (ClpYQ) peptidase subunit
VTCIAGLVHDGTVWIGADSAGVYGQSMIVRADAKAFTAGPYAFGFTSSFRMGQLIRYAFTPPVPEPDRDLHAFMCTGFINALRDCLKEGGWAEKDKERETGGNFLVGVHGRLFEVFSDYQVGEREEPFAATGCGESFALGSLHVTQQLGWMPGERILAALQAAERFSSGVQGPFRIVRTAEP